MTKELTLPDLARILWAARIDATANRWHITRRTIPTLTKLAENAENAEDARLRKAAEHATTAVTHLDAMLESLRTAIGHLEPLAQRPSGGAAPTELRRE